MPSNSPSQVAIDLFYANAGQIIETALVIAILSTLVMLALWAISRIRFWIVPNEKEM